MTKMTIPKEEEEEGKEIGILDLPDLPLYTIAKSVGSPADFGSFRHVSKITRTIARAAEHEFLSSQPPWLCSIEYDRLYDVIKQRFYMKTLPVSSKAFRWAVGFSSGYLILADCNVKNRIYLVNPLTGHEAYAFPKAPYAFSRAVLTTPLGTEGCMLLAFNSMSVQYCRPGESEWGVYRIPVDEGFGPVRNLAMFGSNVYGLTLDGKIGTIHFDPCPQVKILESHPLPFGKFQGTWLGSCGDDLLAITCTYKLSPPRSVDGFSVYRFDFFMRKWTKIQDLQNMTLFLDQSWGVLCLKDPKIWGGMQNCIYFTDPMKDSLVVYHMKDGRMQDVTPTCTNHSTKFRWDLSVWIIPSLICY